MPARRQRYGVDSGKYYAAILIGENFSRNMYDLKSALTDDESTITYYVNAKTNAIATKITDTAAETVKTNIQVEYLKVLFQTVFTTGQELGDNIDETQAVNAVISQLTDLSKSLRQYSASIKPQVFTMARSAPSASGTRLKPASLIRYSICSLLTRFLAQPREIIAKVFSIFIPR